MSKKKFVSTSFVDRCNNDEHRCSSVFKVSPVRNLSSSKEYDEKMGRFKKVSKFTQVNDNRFEKFKWTDFSIDSLDEVGKSNLRPVSLSHDIHTSMSMAESAIEKISKSTNNN